tara:strand:+ start:86 stop:283 length:198 start_codon:yes stop_codon:yes gene_type:complete
MSRMKYKAEVKVASDPKWYSNALRFDTFKDAEEYAKDLFNRWLATTEWRVVKDEENSWIEGEENE